MTKIVHSPNPAPLRAAAYPTQGDQLDALWKAFGALAEGKPVPQEALDMHARVREVKARYPKKVTK